MSFKKTVSLLFLCMSLMLSACGIEELMPKKTEASPEKTVHADWKAYYTQVLGGDFPEELNSALAQRMMPKTPSSFRSYFLCDWDGDGVPELFLNAIQTRYVFVLAADETLICADVYGINCGSSLVFKGSAGLTADPDINSWQVLLADGKSVDFAFDSDGKYSVNDPASGTKLNSSSSDKASALYRQLFKSYVPSCTPICAFEYYELSDLSGLGIVQKGDSELRDRRAAACEAFEAFCSEERYLDYGMEYMNDTPTQKTFYDFELDGIPELILTNGSVDPAKRLAHVFEYSDEGIVYLGIGPVESYYSDCLRGSLIGYAGNVWTLYTRISPKYNIKIMESDYPFYPVMSDDMTIVKGFPINPLPYDSCEESSMLAVSFYRA